MKFVSSRLASHLKPSLLIALIFCATLVPRNVLAQATPVPDTTTNSNPPEVAPVEPQTKPVILPEAAATKVVPATNGTPKQMKTVVVTGSLIPTADAVPIVPVITITAEDIAKQGAATLSEVVKRLPQNRGSLDDKFQAGFAPGSSEASLRGLGAKYTLVLLNGHRTAAYGFGQGISDAFTDLNSLPASAIERIEVLPEGASAMYGSDAIAGVINIILKKDFQGVELMSRFGDTFRRDLFNQTYSITAGFHDKKNESSVMVNVDYFHQDALRLKDRGISGSADHTAVGGDTFLSNLGPVPGYFFAPDGASIVISPTMGIVDTPFSINTNGTSSAGTGGNAFDYNPYLNISPEVERYGTYIMAQHKINDNIDLSLELSYRVSWAKEVSAPTPITGDQPPNLYGNPLGQSFIVPAQNPYNIFGTDLSFRYRLLEAGSRIDEVTTKTFFILPTINIHMANDWEAQANFQFNPLVTESKSRNYLNADAVQAALYSTNPATALNVFAPATNYDAAAGLANNPALIESLKASPRRKGESSLVSAQAGANGTLFQLPGGKLRLGVGVEGHHEAFEDSSDSLTIAEKIVSSGYSSGKGHRDSFAVYSEISIPVFGADNALPGLRALDFNISARFDNYSDFGDTINPKFAFKYSPHEDLVFRGSYGTGFRAPSLRELYLGRSISYVAFRDPDTNAPAYNQFNSVEYRILTGGNPTLQPETSENWSASLEYDPSYIPGLTLKGMWSKIHFKNAISSFDPEFIARNYPDQVMRNPITHEITTVTNTWANFGNTEVQSVDMSANYELPTSWGDFTFESSFSWLYSYKIDESELAGTYNNPEWTGYGSIFWKYKRFGAGYTVNWTESFDQQIGYDPTYGFPRQKVDDWITMDLQVSYEFPNDFHLTFGVRNFLDEPAPFSASESEGYSFSYHDPVGRSWYLQATKKF